MFSRPSLPAAGQRLASASATLRTCVPSGTTSPLSSAAGMKAAGSVIEPSRSVMRASASKPDALPLARSTIGWK